MEGLGQRSNSPEGLRSMGTLPGGVFGSLPIESVPGQGRFKRSNSPEGLRAMGTSLPCQKKGRAMVIGVTVDT